MPLDGLLLHGLRPYIHLIRAPAAAHSITTWFTFLPVHHQKRSNQVFYRVYAALATVHLSKVFSFIPLLPALYFPNLLHVKLYPFPPHYFFPFRFHALLPGPFNSRRPPRVGAVRLNLISSQAGDYQF